MSFWGTNNFSVTWSHTVQKHNASVRESVSHTVVPCLHCVCEVKCDWPGCNFIFLSSMTVERLDCSSAVLNFNTLEVKSNACASEYKHMEQTCNFLLRSMHHFVPKCVFLGSQRKAGKPLDSTGEVP